MFIGSAEPDPQYLPPSACFGARAAEKASRLKAISTGEPAGNGHGMRAFPAQTFRRGEVAIEM